MGLADRDYVRNPSSPSTPFGSARMWSLNSWLIIINVAVFVLDNVLDRAGFGVNFWIRIGPDTAIPGHMGPLTYFGNFSALTALYHLQIWRFITFQFLHANGEHIFFNMIGLFFFGPMIETYLGSRRYLAFYLLCGMAGAVSYLILWSLHILIENSWTPLVGASAGIFGVLIAAAQVAPDATVLIYGVLPMRLRAMAYILLGIAVYTVFTAGTNAGGEAAHLGGAVAGFALIKNPRVLNFFEFRPRPRMRYRP
jgi:membrane associated rhomboid family serine protease